MELQTQLPSKPKYCKNCGGGVTDAAHEYCIYKGWVDLCFACQRDWKIKRVDKVTGEKL